MTPSSDWAGILRGLSGPDVPCADRIHLPGYIEPTPSRYLCDFNAVSMLTRAFLPEGTEEEVVLYSTEGRALLFQTDGIPVKTTRSTQGVQVMTLKKSYKAEHALPLAQTKIVNRSRYRARSLPAAGALVKTRGTRR